MLPAMQLSPRRLIEKKRDGETLTVAEIESVVRGVINGGFSDAQVGAWLMAAFLRGLNQDETVALTAAMRDSGDRFDLSAVRRPKVDKHSTGGVGDKVSIPLAPLVAACGLAVPMISGRGLGHSGGTLDKLESIPGMRTDLDVETVAEQVERLGVAMAGQTPELVPADRRLYRLRDVTGTVESPPLIVGSILSKKLVEDLDGLVLDVKCGRGAFFTEVGAAQKLARMLVDTANGLGVRTTALLTAMDEPLGCAVGNAVEIAESIELLHGRGPADLKAVTLALGVEMLVLGGLAADAGEAEQMLLEALDSGMALRLFAHLVEAQGGDPRIVDDLRLLPQPKRKRAVLFDGPSPVWVAEVDARLVAEAALILGAGRQQETDSIDPAAGIVQLAKIGSSLDPGQPLGVLQGASDALLDAAESVLRSALRSSPQPVSRPLLIKERIS
jgi:pyrimidine-nucleoside phosphorylase